MTEFRFKFCVFIIKLCSNQSADPKNTNTKPILSTFVHLWCQYRCQWCQYWCQYWWEWWCLVWLFLQRFGPFFSRLFHIRSSFSVTDQQNICAFCGSRTCITVKVIAPAHTHREQTCAPLPLPNKQQWWLQQLIWSTERRDVSRFQLTTSWLASLCQLD